MKQASLLNYRPSHIAACAVIIAINKSEKRPLTDLYIWTKDQTTSETTGYTPEMLK
jgi:hypothetical protein